jgi:hypothetical protein
MMMMTAGQVDAVPAHEMMITMIDRADRGAVAPNRGDRHGDLTTMKAADGLATRRVTQRRHAAAGRIGKRVPGRAAGRTMTIGVQPVAADTMMIVAVHGAAAMTMTMAGALAAAAMAVGSATPKAIQKLRDVGGRNGRVRLGRVWMTMMTDGRTGVAATKTMIAATAKGEATIAMRIACHRVGETMITLIGDRRPPPDRMTMMIGAGHAAAAAAGREIRKAIPTQPGEVRQTVASLSAERGRSATAALN